MTESSVDQFGLYRCHVGHAFTPAALAFDQAEAVDRSLWAAVRALDESAALARKMAAKSDGEMHARFVEREQTDARNADVLRRVALSSTMSNTDSRVDVTQLKPAAQDPEPD